jgi:carbon-monoxide dehydrogenase small subunit
MEKLTFTVNGKEVSLTIDPVSKLVWVLRNELNLTGTKFGCGMNSCGSCTVIMDGMPVRSCMLDANDADGTEIITIEGLMSNETLHPIQEAFVEMEAQQCGFCTPGMIMNAYGLLLTNPEPSRKEIIDAMEDNLCRCGAHGRIIEAIEKASKVMKGGVLS